MRECEIINENLRCALAGFSWVGSSGDTSRLPGLSLAFSGVPYGLFNTAVLAEPGYGDSFRELLNDASRFFARKRTAWSVWFCEDFFGDREQRRRASISLAAMGLKIVMEAPGMISRQMAPPRAPLPRMQYRRVHGRETAADFSRIMAAAFAVPLEMSNRVYASDRLWTGPVRGYVAYHQGEPVSTTAIVVSGDALGLYAVATHPSYQRKGFGEALMRAVLVDVMRETGLDTVVLQSSEVGFPLYLRMGFRQVTRFSVFLAENGV